MSYLGAAPDMLTRTTPRSIPRSGTSARPVALFVLGMHRSGTSPLTRVLSLCGGTLPAGLLGADSANPLGYWEPRGVIDFNEVILHRHGSVWCNPSLRLQEEGAIDAEEKAAYIAKARKYLTTLPAASLVVIKEPRITLLSDIWFEAANLAGFDVATVIAVRHPTEVISSIVARDRISPECAAALWLKYSLLAERATRALPRVFVDYANLLENPRRETERISAALGIDLDTRDEGVIEEFLKPDLRHQRHCGPVTDPFGADWISAVYAALGAAARDEPWEESALDHVYTAYRASERGFRRAFEDFHRVYKSYRYFQPSILKLVREVYALAYRRRGTWA